MIVLLVIIGLALLFYLSSRSKKAKALIENGAQASLVSNYSRQHSDDGIPFEIRFETRLGSSQSSVNPSVKADDVWQAPGRTVEVKGLTIPDGMLYLGKGLGALAEYSGIEPALVNPALKVDLANPDLEGEGLRYWPSYDQLGPRSRAAYLLWLAAGRHDPGVPIGYVFLFFYGLERRLLFDARTSAAARSEVPLLVQEVQRLLSIYGASSQSFRRYSKSLLEICRVLYSSGTLGDGEPSPAREHYELPLDLAAGLGERLVAEKPVTGPWAFAWLLSHPDARLRTPARRCPMEFEKLFLLRFQQKYPKGLKVKPNKRRLTCDYRTASSGLQGCSVQLEHLPDVRALSGPVNKFRVIADACTDELDAYSRLLGRNPDAAGTLQAFALLPPELAEVSEPEDAQELNRWIQERLLGHTRAIVPSRDLMQKWEHQDPEKLSKKEAVAFAQVLERLGFGMEPDPRFGGPPHKAQGSAVVFELEPKPMGVASREYGAATILLHLAAIVAAADGVVSEEEETHLEQHLEQAMHLEESEKVRLRAHLSWLLSEPPGTAGLKQRLETLSPQLKHQVAEFAVSVAGADGRIDPAEVKALQKLYAMLGLDPESVFADIHGMSTSPATTPVTVSLGEPKTAGRKLPPPPSGATHSKAEPSFELDMERVKAKLKDTAEVASLLSQIFVEDEETTDDASAETEAVGDESSELGLDAGQMKFLLSLRGLSELGRQEFEERCSGLDLLPDAAFEALNGAAFEHADAPLLIGEDPIEIDVEIFEEMCK